MSATEYPILRALSAAGLSVNFSQANGITLAPTRELQPGIVQMLVASARAKRAEIVEEIKHFFKSTPPVGTIQ